MGDRGLRVSVKVGVARFDDGWNVVVDLGGQRRVYDPTVSTEAEALALASKVSAAFRSAMPDSTGEATGIASHRGAE